MILSYIKTSARTIVRHKLFSLINIIGLAVSMSVGLLVISFVLDLLSYDDFHEKGSRIYRIITTHHQQGQSPRDLASTSVRAGRKIRETISGIEDLTIVHNNFGGDATTDEVSVPIGGFFADESFFKVFSFPFLHGDPATALREPYSLVLTEKASAKLFGSANALGKSVKFQANNYVVTGVLKDIPKLSHLRFEALASFSSAELQEVNNDQGLWGWNSIYMNYVYVVLSEETDLRSLQGSLDKLTHSEDSAVNQGKITLSLQPLREIAFGRTLSNQSGPVIHSIAIWILVGLGLIVILSACFNYTNLSIARSLQRTREVGMRKVSGASKGNILAQFMSESVIISLISLAFAFLLFLPLRMEFLSLHSFLENLVSLNLSPTIIICFVALGVSVGIVAGFVPALFFARINAVKVLKDTSSLQLFRNVNMRKGLVVVQYIFSLIFIATTVIGYYQYRGFISFDLGFTTENILNVKLQGNKAGLVIKELSEIPEVTEVSQSRIIMSLGKTHREQVKYKNTNDSAAIWMNFIDPNYLTLHGHTLLAGRNFRNKPENTDETEVIVTEKLLREFDITGNDPQKALGEVLTIDGKNLSIVGVLKDFHYETVEDEVQPVIFRHVTNSPHGYINAKILTNDWAATLAKVEAAWRKVDRIHPLDATFYDEQIEKAYSQFSMMIKVIGFLAFLAVCIASMGLFGMVVFTTETRLKEISIRKVLGASEARLLFLLSKGFLFMLAVAALIALPITYIFFDRVILVNFAYHQPIGVSELLISLSVIIFLAFIMIGSQTLKTARTNPSEVLRME